MSRTSDSDLIIADPTNTAAPLTLSGTQYSRPLKCGVGSKASFHLEWTGTPTTAVTFWTTNKRSNERNDAVDTDWVQETTVTVTGPAGSAGKLMVHISDLACELIRTKLVTSGGAGTMLGWGHLGG